MYYKLQWVLQIRAIITNCGITATLGHAASHRASFPGWVSASSPKLPQQLFLEGGVHCSDRTFGGHPSTLAVGNERLPALRICRADCLTCPALICENRFLSNITSRKYFAIAIKPDEVHCKLQNYIYLLYCTRHGIH